MENDINHKNPSSGLYLNLVSSLVVFVTNLLINFFLSPYIVKHLGVEANGFILLANNFIMYAALATTALNSMSGRFITISFYEKNLKEANKYYSSVTVGNLLLSIGLGIISIICVFNLEKIINIPNNLEKDVKLLFFFVFLNFLITTIFSSWNNATFVTNKLYYQSFRTMQAQLLRCFLIVLFFAFFETHVYFVGVATFLSSILSILYSYYYKVKLLPELSVKLKDFSFKHCWILVSSGIWNTITNTGVLLLSGVDILMANLFIGSADMGILSLAKTLPMVVNQLATTITSLFTPSLTIYYAKKDFEGLTNELKRGMKLTGVLITIPLSILIVFGKDFYGLWVPDQDSQTLQILSILVIFGLIFTSGIQVLFNVFTVINKLKVNSLLLLFTGLISVIVSFLLIKFTTLGIFAIAGISSLAALLRNLCYTVPYCAKYLGMKWWTFFPEVGYSILSVSISVIIGLTMKQILSSTTWLQLFINCILMAIMSLVVNMLIVLNKSDRQKLSGYIKKIF